ncbi:MAG: tetratricopeptide repeat protein [Candidatus Gastranaerophilales bacterium]|nr:tetratricopeptide repeat protein [Candidatus Gastranaerophilales bacterium]
MINADVINIKSEILYREAEDNFFYFNKLKKAVRNLNTALKLTPNHAKSLILMGDIRFIQGKTKEALNYYLQANELRPDNAKILGGIANCYSYISNPQKAILYCDRAFSNINCDNEELYSSLYEIKISNLLNEKKYTKAGLFIKKAEKALTMEDFFNLIPQKTALNIKLALQNRIKSNSLKLINS